MYPFSINTDRNRKIIFGVSVTGGTSYLWSQNLLEPGAWYHITALYDGSRMAVYINGEEDSTKEVSGDFHFGYTNYETHIGKFPGNDAGYINAFIDEVRIFNNALTPEEVTGLYMDPFNQPEEQQLLNEGTLPGTDIYSHWQSLADGYFLGQADVFEAAMVANVKPESPVMLGYLSGSELSYVIVKHDLTIIPSNTYEVSFAGYSSGPTGSVGIDIYLSVDGVWWEYLGMAGDMESANYNTSKVTGSVNLEGEVLYVKALTTNRTSAAIYVEKLNIKVIP